MSALDLAAICFLQANAGNLSAENLASTAARLRDEPFGCDPVDFAIALYRLVQRCTDHSADPDDLARLVAKTREAQMLVLRDGATNASIERLKALLTQLEQPENLEGRLEVMTALEQIYSGTAADWKAQAESIRKQLRDGAG